MNAKVRDMISEAIKSDGVEEILNWGKMMLPRSIFLQVIT